MFKGKQVRFFNSVGVFLTVALLAGSAGCNLGGDGSHTFWFVSTAGNDSNDCQSMTTACRHISEAIQRAQDLDSIFIAAGTYYENLVVQDKILNFVGSGEDQTIIDGGGQGSVFSIDNFHATLPPGTNPVEFFTITIQSLAITNGSAQKGGGIYAYGNSMKLQHVLVHDNTALDASGCGGGLYFEAFVIGTQLDVQDSVFSDNHGNGICLENVASELNHVSVAGNVIAGTGGDRRGGGIYMNCCYMWLENSSVMNNSAYDGGGFYLAAQPDNPTNVKFLSSEVSGNSADNDGGGLWLMGGNIPIEIANTSIYGNEALRGGGIYNASSSVELHESAIYSNEVQGVGGGIVNYGHVTAINVTISGNAITGPGLVMNPGAGGAIFNGTNGSNPNPGGGSTPASGTIEANYVTIADNSAAKGYVGGLFTEVSSAVQLRNSLLVGNPGGNCSLNPPAVASGISTDNTCPGMDVVSDAMIGPLADNGGPTQTYALLAGSPAIDAATLTDGDPAADQRGITRPFDGDEDGAARPDFGAFEYTGEISSASTDQAALVFNPNINAYCRSGPDPIFNSISLAMKGTSYPIDGRNQQNDWYFLRVSANVECWVPADTGTASGDTSSLRVMRLIPTPTFTPPPAHQVDCTQYLTKASCQAVPACTWTQLTDLHGLCTNK